VLRSLKMSLTTECLTGTDVEDNANLAGFSVSFKHAEHFQCCLMLLVFALDAMITQLTAQHLESRAASDNCHGTT
jgi:hypothetical protein